jgi:hypothetical protein
MGPSVLVNEIDGGPGRVAPIEERLVRLLDVSQGLPKNCDYGRRSEKPATAAMVAIDMRFFHWQQLQLSRTCGQMLPVTMAAWTAIDRRVELKVNPFSLPCTMLTISVVLCSHALHIHIYPLKYSSRKVEMR